MKKLSFEYYINQVALVDVLALLELEKDFPNKLRINNLRVGMSNIYSVLIDADTVEILQFTLWYLNNLYKNKQTLEKIYKDSISTTSLETAITSVNTTNPITTNLNNPNLENCRKLLKYLIG